MCITFFRVILTEKSICSIILVIWGHPQGQKVNFKVIFGVYAKFWRTCTT